MPCGFTIALVSVFETPEATAVTPVCDEPRKPLCLEAFRVYG